jgi:hypothetical protein
MNVDRFIKEYSDMVKVQLPIGLKAENGLCRALM